MESQQKTALITGANKGIGFEIARQLGALGFQVIVSGRDNGRVKRAVDQLQKSDINAIPLIMDVGDMKSIRAALNPFDRQLKPLTFSLITQGSQLVRISPSLSFFPKKYTPHFRSMPWGRIL